MTDMEWRPPMEVDRKPRKCPECGHSPVSNIFYGMPKFTAKLNEDLASDKVVLGGCCEAIDGPKWECAECGRQFMKRMT